MLKSTNATLTEVLEDAVNLVQQGWCCGSLAQTDFGHRAHVLEKKATRFSVMGAMIRAASRQSEGLPLLNDQTLRKLFQTDNLDILPIARTKDEAVAQLRNMMEIARACA